MATRGLFKEVVKQGKNMADGAVDLLDTYNDTIDQNEANREAAIAEAARKKLPHYQPPPKQSEGYLRSGPSAMLHDQRVKEHLEWERLQRELVSHKSMALGALQ